MMSSLHMRLLVVGMMVVLSLAMEVARASADKSNVRPACFIFGDSLVDVGNNNYLPKSTALANELPNGIDFPYMNARQPTGRFTNGRTTSDLIGEALGVADFPPPVLAPTARGAALLNGVNYGSGGAGILNDTGKVFTQYISMDEQVAYFEGTVQELNAILGLEYTQIYLAKAIFSITLGANDYLGNYLVPINPTPEETLPIAVFVNKLINGLRGQLIRLYNAGARKMVVVSVPILGCTPWLRSTNFGTNGQCNLDANNDAITYNIALQSLVKQLNQELLGATLVFADAYGIGKYVIENYESFGFGNADEACCGLIGSKKGLIACRYSFVPLCNDREDYFFWDAYHPSEKANRIFATNFVYGSQFTFPINIRQLMDL